MWIFEMTMPNGTKYTKQCNSEEEAMREKRWAKGREFYKNCSMDVFEVDDNQEQKKPSLFD